MKYQAKPDGTFSENVYDSALNYARRETYDAAKRAIEGYLRRGGTIRKEDLGDLTRIIFHNASISVENGLYSFAERALKFADYCAGISRGVIDISKERIDLARIAYENAREHITARAYESARRDIESARRIAKGTGYECSRIEDSLKAMALEKASAAHAIYEDERDYWIMSAQRLINWMNRKGIERFSGAFTDILG